MLTGVYGSGKSSVAEEVAYLLEQRGEPHALLDLDYLSWAGTGTGDHARLLTTRVVLPRPGVRHLMAAGVRIRHGP